MIFHNDFMPPEIYVAATPDALYLEEGDIIAFKNLDGSTRRVRSVDSGSKDNWQTGSIASGQSVYIRFGENAETRFYSANWQGDRTKYSTNDLRNGRIIWGTAPDSSS